MQKLNIFYIYYHDNKFVPIHVSEILNELSKRQHEIHVFTKIKGIKNNRSLFGRKVKIYNFWVPEIRFVSELVFITLLLPTLIIKSFSIKPDIYYNRHSASSLAVVLVSKFLGIPCFLEINDIVLDKLKFIKILKIKKWWVRFYHYISIKLASMTLPVTEQIGSWLDNTYHIGPKKIVVIPNGVNICRFKPKNKSDARRKYNIPENAKVILSLGSLFPWAGLEILIRAAPIIIEAYPDSLFAIGSGEEPYLSYIKSEVKKNGLASRFLFFGFIPWDEAAWFISMADICAAPFIFKNTRSGCSSLRVFAYLACGKPVVGSNIPGLGDMLEKEDIGLSVCMEDHQGLAKAIISLLDNKNSLALNANRTRAFIVRNYDWESIVDKLEACINRQLKSAESDSYVRNLRYHI